MSDVVTIIIADDKERYRELIKEVLSPYPVTVIGEAENGKKLISLLQKKQPDIILLDLEMPVMDGNMTLNHIRSNFPHLNVIILSNYFEKILVRNYLQRGARAFISKDELEDVLWNTITAVSNGLVLNSEKNSDKEKFTARQTEIIPLIFEGLTNDEIADKMNISKRAVEKQRHRIYQNSGAEKAIDFYKYAFTKGLHFLGKNK